MSIASNDAVSAIADNYGVSLGTAVGGEIAISFNFPVNLARNEQKANVKAVLSRLLSGSSVNQLTLSALRDKSSSFESNLYSFSISSDIAAAGAAIAVGCTKAENILLGDTSVEISDAILDSSNAINVTASNSQTASVKALGVHASANGGEGFALSASGIVVSNLLGVSDIDPDKRSKIGMIS